MKETIARIVVRLLRLLLPAPGRHRLVGVPAAEDSEDVQTMNLPRMAPVSSADMLIRPYMLSAEERRALGNGAHVGERLSRGQRRALWLATHGIDVGPCWIRGVEVLS